MSSGFPQPTASANVMQDSGRIHTLFLCTRRSVEPWGENRQILSVTLRDGEASLQGRTSRHVERHLRSFEPGDVVEVIGRPPRRLESRYLLIDSIVRTSDAPEPFLPAATRDIDELWGFLEHWISQVGDPSYRRLLELLFAEDCLGRAVRAAPLTLLGAYAYRGGLLEHVVAVTTLAAELCDLHRGLHRDLLLTAALVHELDVAGWGARPATSDVRRERLTTTIRAGASRTDLAAVDERALRGCLGLAPAGSTSKIALAHDLLVRLDALDSAVGAAKVRHLAFRHRGDGSVCW